MDSGWLDANRYTPSGPEALQASVGTRPDHRGLLQPVLVASWKIKDDGSISYLNATELHVLVMSTNQNICVRYSFKDKFHTMRSPSGEKWSFLADMIVLDPGQLYRVSVFNIPKPEMGHSSYDVSTDVIVAGCDNASMQWTQFCKERGSLWQPNISLVVGGGSALDVGFSPDPLCEEYIVIVSCLAIHHVTHTYKTNQTQLSVAFSLDQWPSSCCQFDVEIKPLFPQCGQDCTRRRTTRNICHVIPTDAPGSSDTPVGTAVTLGMVFLCALVAVLLYFLCRKPGKPGAPATPAGREQTWQQQLHQPPTVLVVYSQDHRLYRDIVLKLCAFLQIKCGIKVLVDLLDSTTVGMVGRLRWLEWQRQQLKSPFDKILVLCSRGVQAKWGAMCGQRQMTLREDLLSPTDDILTPFLNLFLPDMHQAGMLGKYLVAYFDDISSEQDVPSVFDIAVKYKLMKHFEELYFRILDMEKYQPGQVNHVEGIGRDEYASCPSGMALRNAIEDFQAYQLEHPDWFEKECVDDEEEEGVTAEAHHLLEQLQVPPVLECIPVVRAGPPVCIHQVDVSEHPSSVLVLTPEPPSELQLPSVAELTPVVNPAHRHPSRLVEVLTDHSPSQESVLVLEPMLDMPPPPRQTWFSVNEDDEECSLLPGSHRPPPEGSHLDPNPPGCSGTSMQWGYPSAEAPLQQPAVPEEFEEEPRDRGQSSDQGYISRTSSQTALPDKEDPLGALRRLQDQLLQRSLTHGPGPEGN
ncbi:interleukin 17 receptor A1a isoform X2 [Antennarius striatus]